MPAEGRERALWKQQPLSLALTHGDRPLRVSLVWGSVSVCTVLSPYRDTSFGLKSFMVSLPPA